MQQPHAELLAIVEVDKADRVVCQAPGCGHSAYRRIHVVSDGGRVGVYGSDRFGQLFEGILSGAKPRYDTGEGRELTPDERRLLAENTEALIAKFESERQQGEEQARLRGELQARLEEAASEQAAQAKREADRRRPPTEAELASVWPQAKAHVRQTYSADPDLPGWYGLVRLQAIKQLGK
jgi:hypothetical protein